jgi:hypothetical protein
MRRALLLGTLLSLLTVAPVLAAAPTNDTPAGAITVVKGQVIELDTDEATSDDFELGLNICNAPAIGGAVWFKFVPTEDGIVAVDVSGSDFSAGVYVFFGEPAPETVMDCGPGRLPVSVAAGETYYVMAFGDGLGEALTGNLVLTIDDAVPPPALDLRIDRDATVDRFGTVHITGTVTCEAEGRPEIAVELVGELRQKVGRLLIAGSFEGGVVVPCDGTATPFDVFSDGANGVFAGGKAATLAVAFGCTDLCGDRLVEANIQLRRSGK